MGGEKVRLKSTDLIVLSGLRKHFIRYRKKCGSNVFPLDDGRVPDLSAQLDIGVASIKKVPIPLQRILTAQSFFMNPVSQNRDSLPGKFSYSAFSKELDLLPGRALDEVISLTAEEMARASRLVTSAYNELLQVAASLEDQAYRRLMTECIASPKITFLDLYPTTRGSAAIICGNGGARLFQSFR